MYKGNLRYCEHWTVVSKNQQQVPCEKNKWIHVQITQIGSFTTLSSSLTRKYQNWITYIHFKPYSVNMYKFIHIGLYTKDV